MDDCEFDPIFKNVIKEPVDVLFIDTSHLYEHTVRELAAWFPLLANKALVIFHDTNLFLQSNECIIQNLLLYQ